MSWTLVLALQKEHLMLRCDTEKGLLGWKAASTHPKPDDAAYASNTDAAHDAGHKED